MGKRSNFERRAKDFYETPVSALIPLIPHLPAKFNYIEPCVGKGALVAGLTSLNMYANCVGSSDIDTGGDAMTDRYSFKNVDFFITNPPWSRDKKSGYLLHNIIRNLSGQLPTWLLFDADWMHTKQAAPFLRNCVKIVSVGRISWMENGVSGKDNCAWYLFDGYEYNTPTEFIARQTP